MEINNSKRKKSSNLSWVVVFLILFGSIAYYYTQKKNEKIITEKSNNVTAVEEPKFIIGGTVSFYKGDSLIKKIEVEIADDENEKAQGLMYRKSMGENVGMIFLFDEEKDQSFWMKNTFLALDIMYIAKDWKVVSIQEYAIPYNETALPSDAPAQYVVEVNAGFSDRYKIGKGTRIEFKKLETKAS